MALAFVAGALTLLSPCVLPLLPVVILSARQTGPSGPVWLMLGLALSFTLVVTLLLILVTTTGINPEIGNRFGGILLILIGFIMMIPILERNATRLLSRLSNTNSTILSKFDTQKPHGQFAMGALLALVWTPCVGPTVGAGMGLIAKNAAPVTGASVLLAYCLGLSAVLALVGVASSGLTGLKPRLRELGSAGKRPLGFCLALIGILSISGFDKVLETRLEQIWPDWAQNLSTYF